MSDADPIEVRAREHARAALDKWENTQGVGLDESMAIGFAKALRIERELALRKAASITVNNNGLAIPLPTAHRESILALLTPCETETPDDG